MALSEEEQRLLEQLEASLAADDPKLATTMTGTPVMVHKRRAALAGFGFIVGICLLIFTLEISPFLSVIGFVVMLASVIAATSSWKHVTEEQHKTSRPTAPRQPTVNGAFFDEMEDRWRRRQEGGL